MFPYLLLAIEGHEAPSDHSPGEARVARINPGATLTPHFREFLPAWIAGQPWYGGAGFPLLTPVGYFRMEDPAGAVGIETHLLSDESALYQLPMTYRDAPLDGAEEALITTARHSVLGKRWIYDGPGDPVWAEQLLRLVHTGGVSADGGRRGVGPAEARGHQPGSAVTLTLDSVIIDLTRVLTPGNRDPAPGTVGLVTGTWYPNGPDAAAEAGCLAAVRSRIPGPST